MKYCYQCNRVTQGEPLFCNFCGRSYATKLCPRGHKNPRNAQSCSQCGSKDLSTPAPKPPLWVSLLVFLLSLVPTFLLILVSLLVIVLMTRALLTNPRILANFAYLTLVLIVLWFLWSKLPLALRKFIRKQLLEREKEGRK